MTDAAIVPIDPMSQPLSEQQVTYKSLQALFRTSTIPQRYKDSPTGVGDMHAATIAGAELGIGAWTSIHEIFIVNGQSSMQGKLMLALVWRAGHKVTVDISETESTVHCWRRHKGGMALEHVGDVTFTVEDAATAGLVDKGTYRSYPKIMLTWRAVSMACRLYFPDCILSVGHVPEEVGINAPIESIPGYVLNDDGSLQSEAAILELNNAGLDVEVVDEIVFEAEIMEET